MTNEGLHDRWDLGRFVVAQDTDGTYDRALAELRRGRKTSHWMWYVFPQLAGLGLSPTSRLFAISGCAEALAHLRHPVLGPRLLECTRVVAGIADRTAEQVFGAVDAQKLHSSMTLFHRAASDEPLFAAVLDRYFAGAPDPGTDRLLAAADS